MILLYNSNFEEADILYKEYKEISYIQNVLLGPQGIQGSSLNVQSFPAELRAQGIFESAAALPFSRKERSSRAEPKTCRERTKVPFVRHQ